MMNLEKYFKKYIWDDNRTPYLVPVARMSRQQADYEIRAFAIFVGVLFAMVTAGALLSQDPEVRSESAAVYGLTVVCAAIILGFTKHAYAAIYCGAVPVVALVYFFVHGFHPNLSTIDHVVMITVGLIWLRYSFRMLAIARTYPAMPEATEQT